jgi:pimeloyl-ACP methyl ester carboxylesterase
MGDVVAAGTPILLVHGLVDNRSVFTLLRRTLRRRGFGQVIPVNYSPFTQDVRTAAARLARLVEKTCEETGYERVHVVGHSLGGVVARYYVQRMGGDARVHTLCTLGSPHAGTLAAHLLPSRLVRQLRPGSELMQELAAPSPGCRTRFVAFWSDLDQLIVPKRSARIEHADLSVRNVLLRGVGHMSLPIDGRSCTRSPRCSRTSTRTAPRARRRHPPGRRAAPQHRSRARRPPARPRHRLRSTRGVFRPERAEGICPRPLPDNVAVTTRLQVPSKGRVRLDQDPGRVLLGTVLDPTTGLSLASAAALVRAMPPPRTCPLRAASCRGCLLAAAGIAFGGLAAFPASAADIAPRVTAAAALQPVELPAPAPEAPANVELGEALALGLAEANKPKPVAKPARASRDRGPAAAPDEDEEGDEVGDRLFARPGVGRLTSSYGRRWGRLHAGIDLASGVGSPVRAVTNATVLSAGWEGGYGRCIRLIASDGTVFVYGHLSSISVSDGERVSAGERIGSEGNTGHSTARTCTSRSASTARRQPGELAAQARHRAVASAPARPAAPHRAVRSRRGREERLVLSSASVTSACRAEPRDRREER